MVVHRALLYVYRGIGLICEGYAISYIVPNTTILSFQDEQVENKTLTLSGNTLQGVFKMSNHY